MRSILILLFTLFFVSCGRQSGRRSNTTSYDRRTAPNETQSNNSSRPSVRNTTNIDRNQIATKVNRRVYAPDELFSKYNSAVFMIITTDGFNSSQGSGFFISDDGLAVSNYHVFKGSTKGAEIIKLINDKQYKVSKIIDYNDELDYILFRVELGGTKVNYVPISKTTPSIGEKAYAIGSPRGLENTFSSGEISQIRDNYIIQISVPIDHGSSGGALLNSYGEAIGITTAGIDGSGANLNFAMSIKVINLK